jgi:hypothetical protein
MLADSRLVASAMALAARVFLNFIGLLRKQVVYYVVSGFL